MMTDPIVLRLLVLGALLFAAGGAGVTLRRYFRNAQLPRNFDRRDVALSHPGPILVEFTSPFCHECQVALPVLEAVSASDGAPLAVVDAKYRPDLATKYAIRTTPTILVVNAQGRVTHGWLDSAPTAQDVTEALALAYG
ncbi:MAG: thioredoxin family protein [Actinomycetota bacterium]